MEIFDVVNEKDEVVGQATREECHANPELMHRAIHFTLVDKEKGLVLLTQRSFEQEHDAGKLCFLGEHMVAGESYAEAVKRGVREELSINAGAFSEAAMNIFRYDKQTELVRFFTIEWSREEIKFDREEIVKIEWKTPEELLKEKENYSEMTRFWVERVDWKQALV